MAPECNVAYQVCFTQLYLYSDFIYQFSLCNVYDEEYIK